MKKAFLLFLLLLLLCCTAAQAELRQSDLLDAAFECVEEDNPFLARYKALTGSTVTPRLKLGVPYFYGGQDVDQPFIHEPEYSSYKAWTGSVWYKKGETYFMGFDCTGYIKYIFSRVGETIHLPQRELIDEAYHAEHVFCGKQPMPEDWTALSAALQPGDIWIIRHPDTHVMMYIGTLRDFGYTAEELPLLADYLDYPLVIHCGEQPDYFDRMKNYGKTCGVNYMRFVKGPDGGVAVSILGVSHEAAEQAGKPQDAELWWFNVEGVSMTTLVFDDLESDCWYRMSR